MVNENQRPEYHNNNILSVLVGLLIGGLVGAVATLLLAPQSGEDTRMQIKKKGIELRGRAAEMMEDTMSQVRLNANKIMVDGRGKLEELKHHGRELALEQLDHVSEAAKAGKKAIQAAKSDNGAH